MSDTYLLVSSKHPYRAYRVGSKEYCEAGLLLKKYQKGYHVRPALDDRDGQYTIILIDGNGRNAGLMHCVGYLTFARNLSQPHSWAGTYRDWYKMEHKDIPVQNSIRGFGQHRSQEENVELYKTEL